MKRKRLALLLAVAMTVTSLDSTAMFVSGADFSSEVEEVATQAEEGVETADEDSASVDFSDEEAEVPETSDEADVEVTEEETSQDEADVQIEEKAADADFSAEIQEDAAADAGGIPSEATEIALDKDYEVSLNDAEDSVRFKFTPSESGSYIFSSDSKGNRSMHPIVYYHDVRYDIEDVAYDNRDNDFVFSCYLDEGETYYYQVKLNEVYGEITPFTVRMEKALEVESVTPDFSGAKTEYIAGLEKFSAKGVKLNVQYKGQDALTVLTFGDSYSIDDTKGNSFGYYIDAGDEVSYDEYLPVGSYDVIFTYNGRVIEKLLITMKNPDASMFDKLNIGKNTVEVKESESSMHWYSFKVENDGFYRFSIWASEEDTYSMKFKKIGKDGNIADELPEWDEDNEAYPMEAGDTYLIGWYDEESRNAPYNATVTVTKILDVKSVEIISADVKDEYIEHFDYVYLENLKAKVTYEDGSSQTLESWEDDFYGRSLDYQLYDKNGNYVSDAYPAAGDYVFRISCNGVYAAMDIPVKVVAKDSRVNKEIGDGTTDLENNEKTGKILLKYTASESGRYQFDFNVSVSNVSIIKADGDSAENIGRQGRSTYADLEKSTVYYIYATPDEFCKKLNVNVKLTTRPTALAVKSLRKEAYIAGIDSFDADDMETTVSFGNTSSTVRGTGAVDGYGVGYRLTNENGNTVYSSDTLSKGTWTVTPYLRTGSAIEIPAATTTVESKMYSDAELNAFPALKENDWNSLDNTHGERKIYTFKPSETGAYKVEYTVENYDAPVSIYEPAENEYCNMTEIGEENPTVRLDASKTYLIVNESGAAKVKFTRANSGLKPETVKEFALTDGMKKAVEIDKTAGYIKCTFTPKEDGYYTLKSSWYEGMKAYTYAELYQGNNYIDSNNYDADYDNFELTNKLSAGKSYVYEVRFCSEYAEKVPFVLEFNKTEKKEIKSADLVLKNGKNAADLSIFDNNIGDFYQLKLTYTDGSTWTTDIEGDFTWLRDVTDLYGAEIEISLNQRDSLKKLLPENKMDVEITIGYYVDGRWNYDNKKTISFKAAGSLPELKEGQNIKAPKNRTMYKFIPQKTAEYIWGFEGKANIAYATLYTTNAEYLYVSPEGNCYEGQYRNYSAKLEAGKVYYLSIGSYQGLETNETFFIKPVAKTLNGLTVKQNPTKKELLPNNGNQVSLSGLQVEASYTDGSKETITYGKPDSCGRYVHFEDAVWQANGKAKVYVALGRYTASFELETASWDKVEEIKLGESKTLKIAEDDVETLKFVPKETGIHYINITNGYLTSNIRGANSSEDRYYDDGCVLKAGETYYLTVRASQANPVVKVVEACKDDKHSFSAWNTVKAATCVTEGLRNHTCTICGKYEEEVIPATGKHTMSSWKVTSGATVLREGSKERICSVCGRKETAKIAKLKPTIKLNVAANKTIPLKVKQSFQAKVSGLAKGDRVISWTSSNKNIASVDKNGKIVGKKVSTATITITVKLQSGLTTKFNVKVQKSDVATTSLTVVNKTTGKTLKSATLKVKKTLTLVTTVAPVTSKQKVTYSSSDKKIATVSSKGVITAKKKGTVTITVKSGKKTVKIKVKVTK